VTVATTNPSDTEDADSAPRGSCFLSRSR
jgi:hypothetical protein